VFGERCASYPAACPSPLATVKRAGRFGLSLGFTNRQRPSENVPTAANTTAHTVRPLPALLAAVGCAGLLGLSIVPPSSTRIEVWPWAAFAALGWLLPIGIAWTRLALNRPAARFGGALDGGLLLLAVTATISTLASPLRGAVSPHLLPVLGTCALPFALLPLFQPETTARTWRLGGAVIGLILVASLVLWLEPWNGLHLPGSRNEQPFGHANITGSVAVLAATWLAAGATRERGGPRIWFIAGAVLAVLTAVSSESRGAVIALAVAGALAAAIVLLSRGRRLVFALLVITLVGGAIASNARLRDLVVHRRWSADARESNDQRTAMLVGGLRLGVERPWLGWGPGSVPHAFPRERADLPGTADNVLQLHNSPVQLWATLGGLGLLAGLLIIGGAVTRLRGVTWTAERTALAAGLGGAIGVLMFDHPFATPIFAVLAAAHLAALATATGSNQGPSSRNLRLPALVAALALLVPALCAAARDLAARQAYDGALGRLERGDAAGYAAGLRDAGALNPDDPYYPHLLAAWLATGHPLAGNSARSPAEAAALLRATLVANPDLEYAHYNLGWLLIIENPAEASEHFLRAAHLAPERGEVYFGLGCARLNLGDTPGAIRAFAAEWLLNPATAWSPVWSRPPFDVLRPHVRALATATVADRGIDPWADLETPAPPGAPYRRLRTGYGVLMGHPDGRPPVDFNIQEPADLPAGLRPHVPVFGWLDGAFLLNFLDRAPR